MQQNGEHENNTQRIEAFSDGVFAIAITLLILEIKIPHPNGTGQSLTHALLALWPSYLTYVLSFLMIGIYWANHHYVFQLYQRTDHVFNLLNVFFLMCISFLPLPTAVLGENVTRLENQRSAVIFYAIGLMLPALGWLLKWLYASHNYRLIDVRLAPSFVRLMTWQYVLSLVFYSGAVLATFYQPRLGLTICVGLTMLYLLPPKKPVYR